MPFIRDQIDEGFYVQLMADEYFLPHTPFYEKIHHPHAIMVFGYDDHTEMLETLGFNRARNIDRILKIITLLDDIAQREERILKDVLKAL